MKVVAMGIVVVRPQHHVERVTGAIPGQAQREAKRNRGLGNLVPGEQLEESQSRVARAEVALSEPR